MKTRIYKPNSDRGSLLSILKEVISELPHANALGYTLAVRNLKAKYRQSFLGLFWVIFPVITTSIIWIMLSSSKVIRLQDPIIPYPVFVVIGTTAWQLFANAVQIPIQSFNNNRSLLVKINFPRESVFISGIYEIIFNSLLTISCAVLFAIFFGIFPDWTFVYFFPIMITTLILGIGIGLTILPLAMLFKDIQFVLPVLLQFLMYLSPVVYVSADFFGLKDWMIYNPMFYLVHGMRDAIAGRGDVIEFWPIFLIGLIAFFIFLVGTMIQKITMEILVERMGS